VEVCPLFSIRLRVVLLKYAQGQFAREDNQLIEFQEMTQDLSYVF